VAGVSKDARRHSQPGATPSHAGRSGSSPAALDTGRRLSSGRATRGPVGRYDEETGVQAGLSDHFSCHSGASRSDEPGTYEHGPAKSGARSARLFGKGPCSWVPGSALRAAPE